MAHIRRKDFCAEAYVGPVRPVVPTGPNNQTINPTIDLEALPANPGAPVDFVFPSSPPDDEEDTSRVSPSENSPAVATAPNPTGKSDVGTWVDNDELADETFEDLLKASESLSLRNRPSQLILRNAGNETDPADGKENTLLNILNFRVSELVTLPGGRTVLLGKKHLVERDMSFHAVHSSMVPPELPGMVKIMQTLRQAGAPLKVTDKILRVVEEEIAGGRFTPHKLPRSVSTFSKVLKLFPVPTPTMMSVPYEGINESGELSVCKSPVFPVFNFLDQLQDLLDDEVFSDLRNLVVNPDDPWGNFIPGKSRTFEDSPDVDSCRVDEIHDGAWYQNIQKAADVGPYEFILGVQFNVDKTGAIGDAFQRHSSEPFMFTLSILNEDAKRKPHLWKPLGFLPDPGKQCQDGSRVRNYHAALGVLLSQVAQLQETPPTVRVRLGGEYKYLVARIYVINCICDCLANELLVGRRQWRLNGCRRLCRACHVSFSDSSDAMHRCQFLTQYAMERIAIAALGPEEHFFDARKKKKVQQSNGSKRKRARRHDVGVEDTHDQLDEALNAEGEATKSRFNAFLDQVSSSASEKTLYRNMLQRRMRVCGETLKVIFCQHVVDNAFFPLDMGPNPQGIFGATPTDLMHAFEEGVVPYLLEIIIDPLDQTHKSTLDRAASQLFAGNNRRGVGRSDYPRVTFSGDFTSLTLLSADEKMGKLLLLFIIGLTPPGRKVLDHRCGQKFDDTKKKIAQQFKGSKQKKPPPPDAEAEDAPGEPEPALNGAGEVTGGVPESRWARVPFNKSDSAMKRFVKSQFSALGLQFLHDLSRDFDASNKTELERIVWESTRSAINNDGHNLSTNYSALELPGSAGCGHDSAGICDRRPKPFTPPPPAGSTTGNGLYYNRSTSNSRNPSEFSCDNQRTVSCNAKQLLELMEMLLAFHAWYKYDPTPNENPDVIEHNIKLMLSFIATHFRRSEKTCDWNLSKFHELLHLVTDSYNFGSPKVIDTGKTELGLRQWVKNPSLTVPKRGVERYTEGLARRLSENLTLEKARIHTETLPYQSDPDDDSLSSLDDATTLLTKSFQIVSVETSVDGETRTHHVAMKVDAHGKRHKTQDVDFPIEEVEWLFRNKHVEVGGYVYSEVRLKDGSIVRAHPNYRQSGPWYDWVTEEWETSSKETPFKCLGFFVDKRTKAIFAYGRNCLSSTERKSTLLYKFKFKQGFAILDLEGVKRSRVFALEPPADAGKEQDVFLLSCRKTSWPHTFRKRKWLH